MLFAHQPNLRERRSHGLWLAPADLILLVSHAHLCSNFLKAEKDAIEGDEGLSLSFLQAFPPSIEGAVPQPQVLFSCVLAGWVIGRFPAQPVFSPGWQFVEHLVRALIPGQRKLPALSPR